MIFNWISPPNPKPHCMTYVIRWGKNHALDWQASINLQPTAPIRAPVHYPASLSPVSCLSNRFFTDAHDHSFIGFFNGHSQIKQTARERVFSWGYGLNNTKPIKLISYYLTNLLGLHRSNNRSWFTRSLSLVQFVAPRQIHAEMIYLRVDLLDLRVIHACEWPLRNPARPSSVINFKENLMRVCLVS